MYVCVFPAAEPLRGSLYGRLGSILALLTRV